MLLRWIKGVENGEVVYRYCDHTEIENVDIKWRLGRFFGPHGDELYEHGPCKVEPGDVVFDLGCNIGLWSIYAIRRGAEQVVAFEPNVANWECAQDNIKRHALLNGMPMCHVQIINAGITDTDGRLPFYESETVSQHGFVDRGHGNPFRLCETWTMDTAMLMLGLDHIDYWKVDANASEYLVVRGLSDANLSKIRKLAMQYHHWVVDHDPTFKETWIKRLRDNGFTVYQGRSNEFGDFYIHAWRE